MISHDSLATNPKKGLVSSVSGIDSASTHKKNHFFPAGFLVNKSRSAEVISKGQSTTYVSSAERNEYSKNLFNDTTDEQEEFRSFFSDSKAILTMWRASQSSSTLQRSFGNEQLDYHRLSQFTRQRANQKLRLKLKLAATQSEKEKSLIRFVHSHLPVSPLLCIIKQRKDRAELRKMGLDK